MSTAQTSDRSSPVGDWQEGQVIVASKELGLAYVVTASGARFGMSVNYTPPEIWDKLIPANSVSQGTVLRFRTNAHNSIVESEIVSQPQIDVDTVYEGEIDTLPMGIGNLSGAGGPPPHIFTTDEALLHIFNHESGASVQLIRDHVPDLRWDFLKGMRYDEQDQPIQGSGTRVTYKFGPDNRVKDVQIVGQPEDFLDHSPYAEGEIIMVGGDNEPDGSGGLIYVHDTRKLYEFQRAAVGDDVWSQLQAKPFEELLTTGFKRESGTRVRFLTHADMQAKDLSIVRQPVVV